MIAHARPFSSDIRKELTYPHTFIPTTGKDVSLLRKAAKIRKVNDNITFTEALERVANEAGYLHWKHVLLCASHTPREFDRFIAARQKSRDGFTNIGTCVGVIVDFADDSIQVKYGERVLEFATNGIRLPLWYSQSPVAPLVKVTFCVKVYHIRGGLKLGRGSLMAIEPATNE